MKNWMDVFAESYKAVLKEWRNYDNEMSALIVKDIKSGKYELWLIDDRTGPVSEIILDSMEDAQSKMEYFFELGTSTLGLNECPFKEIDPVVGYFK